MISMPSLEWSLEQLKDWCAKNQLPVSGTKPKLVQRLLKHIEKEAKEKAKAVSLQEKESIQKKIKKTKLSGVVVEKKKSGSQTKNASTKQSKDPVEIWFNKFIAPEFLKNDCLPSWNWVLDLAERKFKVSTEIYDRLFVFYQQHEEKMLQD